MATITLTLSSKIDKLSSKREVLIRFTHTGICRNAGSRVFVQDKYWNQSEQEISTSTLEETIKESRRTWRSYTPERTKQLERWTTTLAEHESAKKSLEEHRPVKISEIC